MTLYLRATTVSILLILLIVWILTIQIDMNIVISNLVVTD
nr:MAG TPA: hypothetical protein [Crassvirales sp.]